MPVTSKKDNRRGCWFKALPKETRIKWARMGGLTVSEDREHMREIARLGGLKLSQDKEHMREIGRLGSLKSRKKPQGKRTSKC